MWAQAEHLHVKWRLRPANPAPSASQGGYLIFIIMKSKAWKHQKKHSARKLNMKLLAQFQLVLFKLVTFKNNLVPWLVTYKCDRSCWSCTPCPWSAHSSGIRQYQYLQLAGLFAWSRAPWMGLQDHELRGALSSASCREWHWQEHWQQRGKRIRDWLGNFPKNVTPAGASPRDRGVPTHPSWASNPEMFFIIHAHVPLHNGIKAAQGSGSPGRSQGLD